MACVNRRFWQSGVELCALFGAVLRSMRWVAAEGNQLKTHANSDPPDPGSERFVVGLIVFQCLEPLELKAHFGRLFPTVNRW
jgi:hypothetical protein